MGGGKSSSCLHLQVRQSLVLRFDRLFVVPILCLWIIPLLVVCGLCTVLLLQAAGSPVLHTTS